MRLHRKTSEAMIITLEATFIGLAATSGVLVALVGYFLFFL